MDIYTKALYPLKTFALKVSTLFNGIFIIWYLFNYKVYQPRALKYLLGIVGFYYSKYFHISGRESRKVEALLEGRELIEFIDDEEFLDSGFLKILEHLVNQKIFIFYSNPMTGRLVYHFRHWGRLLINNQYSCQVMDITGIVSFPVRQSIRYWGCLSYKMGQIFSRWFEAGWINRMQVLWKHGNNLKLQLQGVEISRLDRFPHISALNLWSFVGLSGGIHCTLCNILLAVTISIRLKSSKGIVKHFALFRKIKVCYA